MLTVGLTGGIASGKSTIARAVKEEPGIAVIEADRIAWETYHPGSEVYRKLIEHFGRRIAKPDGTINRHALGRLIFRDEAERRFVNRIVHPAVMARLKEIARSQESQGVDLLIVEAALLLESEAVDRQFFDYYVVVKVEPEEQIRRLMERDGIGREEAVEKISSQTRQDEKLKCADEVIESSGNVEDTIQRAKALFSRLRQRAAKGHP